mgnify:CR=1 FL=1
MKTHNIKLIAAIALCITLTGIRAHASDFKTIYNRMYEKYLDRNPSKETIGGLMKSLSPEGAFVTLNYRATDGSPRKHVQNLITLPAPTNIQRTHSTMTKRWKSLILKRSASG